MKYDLVVVGGGPGGLMAAKTAAEDGLKVVLVERKRNVTEVNRLGGGVIPISLINVRETSAGLPSEPISIEVCRDKSKINFERLGLSIDYNGPLRPYCNFIFFSPSGYKVYQEKDSLFAFFLQTTSLLAGLLASAEKAGAEVLNSTLATGAEQTSDGVKVFVRGKSGKQTLEARKAIAADGKGSTIVESLGLNKTRPSGGIYTSTSKWFGYVLEGVDTEYRLNSWVGFTIPSLSSFQIPSHSPVRSLTMSLEANDTNMVITSALRSRDADEAIEKFMKLPFYEPWFRHARVVKKMTTGGRGYGYGPISEPVVGNVLIIGDAAALLESTTVGAIACGYLGAKAIMKELNGESGYPEYVDWWQKTFESWWQKPLLFFAFNTLCTDEEVDYLYQLLQGEVGLLSILVTRNLERIKDDRPKLYEKLTKGKTEYSEE